MVIKPQLLSKNEEELIDNTAVDYASSMFQDGHNRTETDKKAHDAPRYNKAAHTVDPEVSNEVASDTETPVLVDTYHSRDGTDAVGQLDEDGGSLGGTEDELDSLEAGATPVDRNPRMKG